MWELVESLCCSIADPVPCCWPGKTIKYKPSTWVPCLMCNKQSTRYLASARTSHSHRGHWNSESVDGRALSLILVLLISLIFIWKADCAEKDGDIDGEVFQLLEHSQNGCDSQSSADLKLGFERWNKFGSGSKRALYGNSLRWGNSCIS